MDTETTSRRSARRARRAMSRVLIACQEDILVAGDAQYAASDGALIEHLRAQAVDRGVFVAELRRELLARGAMPSERASSMAWLRSIGRHARALVGGWHEGDAYAALVHAEERTAQAYIDALAGWLPADARFGLTRQLARINDDLEEARVQRGQH